MRNQHRKELRERKFIRWAKIDPYLAVGLLGVPCLSGCAICGREIEPSHKSPMPGTYRYVCRNCVVELGWSKKGGAS